MMQQILLSFGGGAAVAVERGSTSFDGTGGDWLRVEDTDMALGTGDFTVEAFIYNNSHVNYRNYIGTRESGQANPSGWCIASDANANLYWYSAGLYDTLVLGNMSANKWYHVACTRESGTHKWFVDGVLQGTNSTSRNYTDDLLTIGDNSYHTSTSNDEPLDGFVSNVRVVKGTALYTSNFAIPTEPLTEVTNTKLLCCKSTTQAGAAAVSPSLGGINDGTVWSAQSSITPPSSGFNPGGEIQYAFDGSTTTMASGAGTKDETFVIDFSRDITVSSSLEVWMNSGASQFKVNDGSFSSSLNNGAWRSLSFTGTLSKLTVKGDSPQTYGNFAPRLSAIRIDGSTILTDPISVNGDAAASSTNPFVNGSVSFDGNDDHLTITGQSDLAFGTSDFTLECWVYFSSSDGTLDTIMETRSSTGASDGFLIGRFHTTGYENKIVLYTDSDYRIPSDSAISNNTWVHVAVVRSGSTTKLYIDGVAQSTTYSDSNNYSNDDLIIGQNVSDNYQIHFVQ